MESVVDLKEYTDKAYLEYSMYVIQDRALPHVGDGLKPVQRRIVYAMSELNLSHTAKYKKSARTIGDVLGKYHPHGDSACYGAMAMMAQPFSFRYPLVDGQGNWGSQDDPQSFAAMRYTEARLSPYAGLLLEELPNKPVPMKKNFDGTLNEPEVLPAQVPMLLINGVTGIAVGMATDVPPHNLREIVGAVIQIIDKPKSNLDDIMSIVTGPDYPTNAAIISTPSEIREAYAKGKGTIRMRCNYHIEKNKIIITDLPFKVSGEKVIEEIANLVVEKKKLPMIEDIQDQSDQFHPTNIIITLKKSAADQAEQVIGFLLAKTQLENNYRVNMNVIGLDGAPKVMGLMGLLQEWIHFRVNTVRRRTEHQLAQIESRLHIVEGLIAAFLNLDEVIRIVRQEDRPKEALCRFIGLTEIQADAVLNTRLAKLAKLEEIALQREHEELKLEQSRFAGILESDDSLKKEVRKELKATLKHYDDKYAAGDRRCPIKPDDPATTKPMDLKKLAPSEPVSVLLSKNGYLRSGRGHQFDVATLSFKTGDEHLDHCDTKSNRDVALINSSGRAFSIPAGEMPSARGYGEPATGWALPEPGTEWITMIDPEASEKWLMIGSEGYGFIAPKKAFETRAKKGKVVMNKAGRPEKPVPVKGYEHLAILTTLGRVLIFPLTELPELEKGKGVKLTGGKKDELMVTAAVVGPDQWLILGTDEKPEMVTLTPDKWVELVSERAKAPRLVSQAKLKKGHILTKMVIVSE
jgi:topoisomerase-4 subunit A